MYYTILTVILIVLIFLTLIIDLETKLLRTRRVLAEKAYQVKLYQDRAVELQGDLISAEHEVDELKSKLRKYERHAEQVASS